MIKKLLLILSIAFTSNILANEVKVVNVSTKCTKHRVCSFDVTLKHADTGWKHYANKWEIYTVTGKLLATRVLYHPHVNEQPFTRTLSGVKIPKGLDEVIVKGHDLVHGYSDDVFVYKFKK
jgi:hypothetical protein